MTAVMIDLETFGTSPDAVISEIAAAKFSIETGEITSVFDVRAIVAGQDRAFDSDTVEWWLQQSGNSIKALTREPRFPLAQVLSQFASWYLSAPRGRAVWAHAGFDAPIIESAFRQFGIECPWRYFHARDLRTLLSIASRFGYKAPEQREGQHTAINDVLHQVRYCHEAHEVIGVINGS